MNCSKLAGLLSALPLLLLAACGGAADPSAESPLTRTDRAQHAAVSLAAVPGVLATTPSQYAINVSPVEPIRIVFAQPIITTTVGPSTLRLAGSRGLVDGSYAFGPSDCGAKGCEEQSAGFVGITEVTFYPAQALEPGMQYTLDVSGVRLAIADAPALRYRGVFTTRPEHGLESRLSTGGGSTCTALPDEQGRARVKCFGINSSGQLGLDDSDDRGTALDQMGSALPFVKLPLSAQDMRSVVQVSAGDGHACALLDDAQLLCWGNNQFGQLGMGDAQTPRGVSWNPMSTLHPVDIALEPGDRIQQVRAGGFSTCVLTEAGHVHCWGRNEQGELGLGDTQHHGDQPGEIGRVDLGTGRRAVQLTMGQWHRCALLDNSELKCWGRNGQGQLGLGDKLGRGATVADMGDNLPALDLGKGRRAVRIEAGGLHTCALLDNAKVACWGSNEGGRLGLGTFSSDPSSPVFAYGDEPGEVGAALPTVALRDDNGPVVGLSAGFDHTCAWFGNGKAQCWGLNYTGQLGLGDTFARGDQPAEMGNALPFVKLAPTRAVAAVSAGGMFGCAHFADGSLSCWGGNAHGQLGLGHTNHQGDGPGEMEVLPAVSLY
jgi:E3 ubiquitin-protein ligase HERC3